MRTRPIFALLALLLLSLAAVSAPADDSAAWLPTLEKGVEAASKSGRPVLVVTMWKTGT